MRHRLALLVLLAALAAGCSHRERSNPLDPGNPHTQGRPVGFVALADDGLVTLRWQPVNNPDVLGFQLYRRAPGEATFEPLSAPLSSATSQYVDVGLLNGEEYRYRLYFLLAGGLSGNPAEDVATPGPLRPWVSDYTAQAVHRLTPDARHVLFSEGLFDGPTFLAVDVSNHVLWVSDTYANRLVIVHPFGSRAELAGLSAPAGIAVDPATQTGWVCNPGTGEVLHVSEAGQALAPPLTGLVDPLALALDPQDGSVWVCENAQDRVRRFAPDGSELWRVRVDRPSRVAVDSLTRQVWVTSFSTGRVIRLLPSNAVRDTLTVFVGPIGVDVDPRLGRAWVADALADRLVALDRSGAVEFSVPLLPEVRDVAADRRTGDGWAVVPGRGAVVRVRRQAGSTSLRWLEGLQEPYGIALDPGAP